MVDPQDQLFGTHWNSFFTKRSTSLFLTGSRLSLRIPSICALNQLRSFNGLSKEQAATILSLQKTLGLIKRPKNISFIDETFKFPDVPTLGRFLSIKEI